jgi:hypothetical protein
VALLLVGVDAATGGSSHVTEAVGGGPAPCSATSATASTSPRRRSLDLERALLFALGIVALVVLALQRPRLALLDAYLVALASRSS